MSKKTDHKKLWRKSEASLLRLQNSVNNDLVPRLMRAEKVLLGVVMGEVDVDKMKEDYFKNNPSVKVKTTKEGKKYVTKDNPVTKPAKGSDNKPDSKVLEG